jgi:hypothetical protein
MTTTELELATASPVPLSWEKTPYWKTTLDTKEGVRQ